MNVVQAIRVGAIGAALMFAASLVLLDLTASNALLLADPSGRERLATDAH